MLPIRTWNTGIVHLGSLHDKRLTIEQKSLIADGEVTSIQEKRENE